MTISLVGSAAFDGALTGTSHTIPYASGSGNWLTLVMYLSSAFSTVLPVLTASGITDSAGNTWHFSVTNTANPPTEAYADSLNSDNEAAIIGWAATASAITSVTVNVVAAWSACIMDAAVGEWSGVSAVDSGNTSQGTVSGSSYQTGSLTLSTSTDVTLISTGGSGFANSLPSGFTRFTGSIYNGVMKSAVGTVPAGTHTVTIAGTAGNQFASAAIALKPSPPPVPARKGTADFGDEERRGWWKKAALLSV